MTIIDAFIHVLPGEKLKALKGRQPEIFLNAITARESCPKDAQVAAAVLTVPEGHAYCLRRPSAPAGRKPYRLSSFENASSVAFGSGAKYGHIQAIDPETDELIHLSAFITDVQAMA